MRKVFIFYRIVVRKTSFDIEKDNLNFDGNGLASQIEETIIDWVSSELEGQRENKIVSFKFSDKESNSTKLRNIGRFQKLSKSVWKMFTDFSTGVHPVTEDSVLMNRRVLRIYLNSKENVSEKNCLWKITVHENTVLQFEPPLSSGGVSIHGDIGECKVVLEVIQPGSEGYQNTNLFPYPIVVPMQLSVPERIEPLDDNCSSFTYQIAIEKAKYFDRDGIVIHWEVFFENSRATVVGQTFGKTSKCFKNKENNFYFSELFVVTVLIPRNEPNSFATLKLRVISEDIWGRQYLEGLTSTFLIPTSIRAPIELKTWKTQPNTPNDELQEFFLGRLSNEETNDQYRTAKGQIIYTISKISYESEQEFSRTPVISPYPLEQWRLNTKETVHKTHNLKLQIEIKLVLENNESIDGIRRSKITVIEC
ncbi:unnamed protein product [Auanema sp. JU1783]|nr:unnamed protein product [Auanema sp. JU1783]